MTETHPFSAFSRIFVAGIDTDAGKTFVSSVLVNGLGADYWKPVQTGTDEGTDSEWIGANTPEGTVIHPEAFRYRIPQSPHWAAKHEGEVIDPDKIIIPDTDNKLIIEGAGGLMVPINDETLYIDWVEQQQLPVVLVVKLYLGCINHSLLSLEALRARTIKCLGIIFNGDEQPEVQSAILEFGRTQQLAHIPANSESGAENLRKVFDSSF